MRKIFLLSLIAVISVLFCIGVVFADDSAVEIVPQGLKYKLEKDISLEKEDLYIGEQRIYAKLEHVPFR